MRFLAEFFSYVCLKHMTVMSDSIILSSCTQSRRFQVATDYFELKDCFDRGVCVEKSN